MNRVDSLVKGICKGLLIVGTICAVLLCAYTSIDFLTYAQVEEHIPLYGDVIERTVI